MCSFERLVQLRNSDNRRVKGVKLSNIPRKGDLYAKQNSFAYTSPIPYREPKRFLENSQVEKSKQKFSGCNCLR